MSGNNLFTGYRVGNSGTTFVSHLQFADDTLILGEKSWANIRAMRDVLLLFQVLSGLKVSFAKSLLVGANVATSWLNEAVMALNCKVGSIPFMYLGLPIGGNARRLSFWEQLINRFKSRLSVWKLKHLSLGGRLILLRYVLSSLPVYALSFFKAPSGIVSSIESISDFFFFGSDDHRKIFWVDWNTVCSSKEVGGLGVRRIMEFNTALLGKWCWRELEDAHNLWCRVLSARYGIGGGRLMGGGRDAYAMCREEWFTNHVRRTVGNGRNTLFWVDVWLGGEAFSVRFNRLYCRWIGRYQCLICVR